MIKHTIYTMTTSSFAEIIKIMVDFEKVMHKEYRFINILI